MKHALILTAQNPLLGVGPGNYMVAENELATDAGQRRGAWHETHNMYLQWSSEVGIPALLCFLWIIIYSLRQVNALQKLRVQPEHARIASGAFWIQTALVSFSACGFFLSVAYVDTLPLLAGLAIAFTQAAAPLRISASAPAPKQRLTLPVRPRVPAR
jgi:hypothetical protein